MPNSVLVIKNVSHEGPGLLGEVLKEDGLVMDIRDLNAADSFPSPREYDAMLVMGGPDSANDDTNKMKNELRQIREALDTHIPYFGVCLGLQTLVKAAGGSVRKNAVREIGASDHEGRPFTVQMTEEGRSDPLFAGLDDPLPMFHLHGETVDLTPTMTLLGSGQWCRNQIVRVAENAYGIQGHLELTPEMFAEWCVRDPDLAKVDQVKLASEWRLFQRAYEKNCRQMFRNFLGIAKVIPTPVIQVR